MPLIKPKIAPRSMPRITAGRGAMPATISFAVTIPERAVTEPTERSMPAISIAKNSPRAMRMLTELCDRICVTVDG